MEDTVKRIKVFVASPSDVMEERNQLPKVIQEINLIISVIAPEKKILLDLIRWETHTFPDMGRDAQGVINKQLPEYEIFIGIMWKRFGTPTALAGSGTEEEFNRAYSKWQQNNNLPVLFYFCQRAANLPGSIEEIEQLKKVINFKENLSNKGLIWEYNDHKDFADIIRPHLVMTLRKILVSNNPAAGVPESTAQTLTESDLSLIRIKVGELRAEYENIRKQLRFSDERTSLMTVVESKMRAMALQILPILPELANSGSAGDRLAAIATLKEIPDPKYLDWLVNRVGKPETNFVGYHATLALLSAARVLDNEYKNQVKKALENAKYKLNTAEYKDPNQVEVLRNAINHLGYVNK